MVNDLSEKRAVDEIIQEENVWSNGSVVLYHVSPADNMLGIMTVGVDPDKSKGRMTASWYVNKRGIVWALAHTSLRHNVSVSELVVFTVMLPRTAVKRTAIPHMFYVKELYKPEYCSPGELFVGDWSAQNE